MLYEDRLPQSSSSKRDIFSIDRLSRNMKIILINPPQLFAKSWVGAGLNPPLDLMCLSASLQNNGPVT